MGKSLKKNKKKTIQNQKNYNNSDQKQNLNKIKQSTVVKSLLDIEKCTEINLNNSNLKECKNFVKVKAFTAADESLAIVKNEKEMNPCNSNLEKNNILTVKVSVVDESLTNEEKCIPQLRESIRIKNIIAAKLLKDPPVKNKQMHQIKNTIKRYMKKKTNNLHLEKCKSMVEVKASTADENLATVENKDKINPTNSNLEECKNMIEVQPSTADESLDTGENKDEINPTNSNFEENNIITIKVSTVDESLTNEEKCIPQLRESIRIKNIIAAKLLKNPPVKNKQIHKIKSTIKRYIKKKSNNLHLEKCNSMVEVKTSTADENLCTVENKDENNPTNSNLEECKNMIEVQPSTADESLATGENNVKINPTNSYLEECKSMIEVQPSTADESLATGENKDEINLTYSNLEECKNMIEVQPSTADESLATGENKVEINPLNTNLEEYKNMIKVQPSSADVSLAIKKNYKPQLRVSIQTKNMIVAKLLKNPPVKNKQIHKMNKTIKHYIKKIPNNLHLERCKSMVEVKASTADENLSTVENKDENNPTNSNLEECKNMIEVQPSTADESLATRENKDEINLTYSNLEECKNMIEVQPSTADESLATEENKVENNPINSNLEECKNMIEVQPSTADESLATRENKDEINLTYSNLEECKNMIEVQPSTADESLATEENKVEINPLNSNLEEYKNMIKVQPYSADESLAIKENDKPQLLVSIQTKNMIVAKLLKNPPVKNKQIHKMNKTIKHCIQKNPNNLHLERCKSMVKVKTSTADENLSTVENKDENNPTNSNLEECKNMIEVQPSTADESLATGENKDEINLTYSNLEECKNMIEVQPSTADESLATEENIDEINPLNSNLEEYKNMIKVQPSSADESLAIKENDKPQLLVSIQTKNMIVAKLLKNPPVKNKQIHKMNKTIKHCIQKNPNNLHLERCKSMVKVKASTADENLSTVENKDENNPTNSNLEECKNMIEVQPSTADESLATGENKDENNPNNSNLEECKNMIKVQPSTADESLAMMKGNDKPQWRESMRIKNIIAEKLLNYPPVKNKQNNLIKKTKNCQKTVVKKPTAAKKTKSQNVNKKNSIKNSKKQKPIKDETNKPVEYPLPAIEEEAVGKKTDDKMAVKKHGFVTDNLNQLDLQALAQYIQLMNEQPGYLPPTADLVKNCQDIVKCLARSPGNEERRWEMLQSIEEFLLHVVNTVDHEARTAIVTGVIDKFYSYISDPQSDADVATSIVLVVLDTSSVESLMSTARWVVQQGENGPAGAGLRASLSCLYSWLSEIQAQGQTTPVLGDWVMSFIKALEESERFDILIEVSVDNLDRLFSAMDTPSTLRQPIADVIFHVLASLRQSPEAFDRISHHVCRVLTNLASDSGQFSRQLLQNVVDILTATVDHLVKKTRGGARVAFKDKYGEVILCLERHMASRGCQQLMTAPWPVRKVCATRDVVACNGANPPAPAERKVGLLNLGNTCYMNSVMQALLVTRRFSTHVMMRMTGHPYWSIAAMLFGKLVHSVSTKLDSHVFFETMRPPFFTSNNQHDSSEFLGYLFELLQSFEHMSDENYDYSKPPVLSTANRWRAATQSYTAPSSDGESAGSGSKRRSVSPRPGGSGGGSGSSGLNRAGSSDVDKPPSRKRYRSNDIAHLRRDSYIDSVFGGVLLTRLECVQCHSTSLSRDVFRDLQLAFPDKPAGGQHNVQSLLEFYCSKERLTGDNQYHCRDCGVLRDAERSVFIENIPKYLILVLKNFKFEPKLQVQSKLIHNMYYNHTITLPTVRAQASHGCYTLYAAVVHAGSTLDSGHYYTLAKDNGTWHKYNDDEVTEANELEINNLEKFSTPYLLFYRCVDNEEDTAPALDDLPAKIQEHVLAHNKHYVDSLRP